MRAPGVWMDDLDVRPHGTTAAVRRHYRHGEPLCRSCKQAQQRAWADLGGARSGWARKQRQRGKTDLPGTIKAPPGTQTTARRSQT